MADTADRKPFRSDDDLPADGQSGVDPLLELSQIAGFEPEGEADPDARQIDLEDALLAELAPQETPAADIASEHDAPVDLPPFIGGGTDVDAPIPTDTPSAPTMETEFSPPLPEPAQVMEAWPPVSSEADPAPSADTVEDVPVFLSTPVPEPEAAPAPPSLEDELAAMLAGDTLPEPAMDALLPDDAGLAPAAEEFNAQDAGPAPAEMSADAAEMMPGAVFPTDPVDPAMAEPAPIDTVPFDAAPVDTAPSDELAADPAETPAPIWDELPAPAAPDAQTDNWTDPSGFGLEPDMGVEAPQAPSLDDDFAQAFDEELSAVDGTDAAEDPFALPASADTVPADDLPADPEPLDPVDELAAIMGYEPPVADIQAEALVGSEPDVARTLDAMDADFEAALDADLSGALSLEDGAADLPPADQTVASVDPAPVLDTVDMSAFETVPASDFDVPEFDGGDADRAPAPGAMDAMFDDAFDREPYAPRDSDGPADDGTHAATAAAMTGTFDSAQFEAELARDMEFVGHDLNAERGADGLDLDAVEESGTPAPAERSGRRGMVIGLVVAGLAVAGVAGVLALSGGDSAVNDGPVLVEADDGPVKVEPEDPGGTTVPNQDRAVFADGDSAEPSQQNLVSTAEEPVDIATAPADSLPAAVAVGEKAEDRLTEGGTEASASDAVAPITPRRVRTLIVRPDGTLEERAPAPVETAVAEPATPEPVVAEQAPVAAAPAATQPAAPVIEAPQTVAGVPVTDTAEPQTIPAPVEDTAAPAAPAQSASETPAAPANPTPAATANETAPVVVRRVQTTTATPPVIRDRPSDQPVNVINRQQVASAPAAAPAPAPQAAAPAQQAAVPVTTTSASTGFSVQLAALPSEEAARATATRLSQQYGGLIAGRGLTIQRAVIEGRGTFYRVRVAANGSGDANALCNSIKASGGNCFVAR